MKDHEQCCKENLNLEVFKEGKDMLTYYDYQWN